MDERKMSADVAKAKVLAVYPEADAKLRYKNGFGGPTNEDCLILAHRLGNGACEDAAWIDAAQRLPTEKEQPNGVKR